MVNKKAWLLVVEVAIAVVIMFSFLFITLSKNPESNRLNLDEEFDYLIKECLENETIRSNLLTENINHVENYLRSKISHTNLEIQLEKEPTETNKDIYASTFVIWDEINGETEFVIYLWNKNA